MLLNLLLTAFVALFPPASASVKDALFCTTKGTVLHYQRHGASDGKLWWDHTESIDDVSSEADGLHVGVTLSITSKIGKSPLKTPVRSEALVHKDGSVEIDVAAAAAEAARQKFSAFQFTSSGGTTVLPATIAPGDVLEEIHSVVSWSGINLTIDYTERSVLRRETITVPAGTYDCIVVQEHKLEKAPLHRRERITLTWYAPGVGMVRHDTLLTDGRTETSEVLVSVER